MKKTILVTMIALLTFVGKAYAEMSYGISVAATKIDASGTETEGGETNSAGVDNDVFIPSLFIEAAGDRFAVGLDYIPFDADVSDKTKTRTDTETSVTGTSTSTTTSRTQSAQASLEDHFTLYGHLNLTDSMYLKAGMVQVSLITEDSLDTGSKYGNADIDGIIYGVGFTDGNSRLEIAYTDYDDFTLSSSVARTGVTTNNSISADLDTLSLKFSYAF